MSIELSHSVPHRYHHEHVDVESELLLEDMGYKPQLQRRLNILGNLPMTLSDITPTASLLVVATAMIATAGTGSLWAYLIGGFIALEGPTCSIFWVRDGRLQTPALETGILASISRRVILESMAAEEGTFPLELAAGAEEAFLASTARLAQPIAAIGEVILPAAPGPLTLRARETIERAMAEHAIA